MNTIRMFVAGDIINLYSPKQFIDDNIISVIKSSDYAVCNFEGTCEYPEIAGLQMVQRPETIGLLKDAGFNLLLIGNNHIADYGYQGLSNTIKKIDESGLDHIGAGLSFNEAYKPLIVEIKGKKIGLLNYCEAQVGHYTSPAQDYGYAWIGNPDNDNTIEELRKDVDYLIIFVHAGLENYELPLKEFRQLYRHYCDLGADVIVGGHPHIAQGIEKYKDSSIIYSLGNFYFPTSIETDDSVNWNSSYSVILEIGESEIKVNPLLHKTQSLLVSKDADNGVDVQRLSNELLEPNYGNKVYKQNILAFEQLPYRLFKEALCGTCYNDSLKKKFKFIIYYLFDFKGKYTKTERNRKALLRRLVENETYRYLTISALNDYLDERRNK